MKILVVDVGGSHVKCAATGHKNPVKFKSGPKLTPGPMVRKVMKITRGWCFDAVSIGYPGVVRRGRIVREPRNKVGDVVKGFRQALLPDYVVLGGGNAEHLKRLPPQTRRGDNVDAFPGGFRLWERPAPASARGNCR